MSDCIQYFIPVGVNITRYFLFAGIPFLIFYILYPSTFSKNKIQSRIAKKKDFIREILYSMQAAFILAGMALLLLKSPLVRYTKVYYDISDFSIWWMPTSMLLALMIHDTYFYWMHRIAHHPSLFKQIHLLHHKSVNPSPWASYSFQFSEAVLEAMVIPIILILIPIHPITLILFGLLSFIFNVYGHLGYEIAPRWFRHSLAFEILNTSTHHNIHHAKFNGNYGLYFRFWDRLLGTEHPDYVLEYDKIQDRRFKMSSSSKTSWKPSIFLFIIIGLGLSLSAAAQSSGIVGDWKDDDGGGTIRIYEENGLYFGQLTEADDAKENKKIQQHGEVIIMKNFEKINNEKYCCGTIYQPREKRTISATLILKDEEILVIQGKFGVFTGSRTWRRL